LDRAIEWTGKVSDTRYHDVKGMASCILAMAQFQKGDAAAARSALATAREIAQREMPPRTADDLGNPWQGWIFTQELIDQAGAMIEPALPPPPIREPQAT
jgi:hypothetical protein